MNNPNPFVPKGSLLEQQSKRRSRLKFAVFCVLAIGVVGLTAMLIQGCKREQAMEENQPPIETNTPTLETNIPPMVEASNPPVQPPPVVAPPAVTTPAPEANVTEYVVVRGDTLAKIAKKNGVTLKALKAANPGVEPAKLKAGQKLSIPASTSSGAAPAVSGGMGEGVGEIYIVKSGDTLTKIARLHGVSVKAIESENNLTTTRIKVGQKLKIPAKAEAPATVPASSVPPPVSPSQNTMSVPVGAPPSR